jgi:hypothetical protein
MGRNSEHLTRGDLSSESLAEVSRGRSSEKAGESRKERRAKEPRDRQLKELWKAEREVSRNGLGASQEHTSEAAQGGESKAVDLLEGTYRGEASPHRMNYGVEVLNEVTMEKVLPASSRKMGTGQMEGNRGQVPGDLVRGTARTPGLRSPWNKLGGSCTSAGCSTNSVVPSGETSSRLGRGEGLRAWIRRRLLPPSSNI